MPNIISFSGRVFVLSVDTTIEKILKMKKILLSLSVLIGIMVSCNNKANESAGTGTDTANSIELSKDRSSDTMPSGGSLSGDSSGRSSMSADSSGRRSGDTSQPK